MADLENVIKGLQEAVDWLSTETSLTVIDQWVVRDALALLKAPSVQPVPAARTMTLEDVRCANEEPMWFESKGTFRGRKGFWVLSKGVSPSYTIRLFAAIGKDDTELSLAVYGKVWRCWTSRPTDEQRKAVAWE